MRDVVLRTFHRLPGPMRSVVASARGWHLRTWRYGPETDRLCDEALARERWPAARWDAWRDERLAVVLHRAATRVPYYRDQWAARRRRGDRASSELLANWPVLEKAEVRADPRRFVADDCEPSRMYRDHTSGTSGTPLDIWLSRPTVRAWYALFEARCRRWYGVSRADRWAIVGGQLVVAQAQDRPPFWVWNAGMRQLYLSAYHLAPAHVPAYIDAMRRHGVRHVLGYPSALFALAREMLAQCVAPPPLSVITVNAEALLAHQRDAITEAFGCPVRETYGMAEIAAAGSECEHGRVHLWPEAGSVELAGDARDGAADLLCTGLLNVDMPLVRYRVGDRVAFSDDACVCGRTLPVLGSVEGRSDDVVFTLDGRPIGRLDPVFKAGAAVREAQIIQEALSRVRVRYVAAPGFTRADGAALVQRVRDRMGAVDVVLEEVPAIPRTSNGKFRAVVCQLSAEERRRISPASQVP